MLNQAQQQERFRALVERAVEELFGGDRRVSWVRRLRGDGVLLPRHRTHASQAQRALAAALALDASTHGGRDIPVCEQLARASLFAFLQMEEQREQEEVRSSLVLTPQQAAREAAAAAVSASFKLQVTKCSSRRRRGLEWRDLLLGT